MSRIGVNGLCLVAALALVPYTALSQEVGGTLLFWRMTAPMGTGLAEPMERVVYTQQEFADLWTRMYSNYTVPPRSPVIDFSKEMVLIIAIGGRGGGGYRIQTESIHVGEAGVRVFARTFSPGKGCMVTAAMTAPVEIVRLERQVKPVLFSNHSVVEDCQ